MAIKQQSPRQAYEALHNNPGAIYLDVRTQAEFAQAHPEGALNVPVVFIKAAGGVEPNDDFLTVTEKIVPKNTKLVVGCMSGGRSQRACEFLEEAGYTDLTNVAGGFGGQRDQYGAVITKGWLDEGLPISADPGDTGYESLRKKANL